MFTLFDCNLLRYVFPLSGRVSGFWVPSLSSATVRESGDVERRSVREEGVRTSVEVEDSPRRDETVMVELVGVPPGT